MTQHAFQTEVTQLLHLMIHALYSEREIFLRELISNASDACDKLRVKALTEQGLYQGDDRLRIDIQPNEEAGTITLTDTGVGLTEADAIEHLGTIAKSGTKAFLTALGGAGSDAGKGSNLIGQFGVGFYSAFMIADNVVVESRAAGVSADQAVRWQSTGDGKFSTEVITRAQRGTTVTLHLKDDAKEFATAWKLRELVKKYSDYVAYPVHLPKYQTDEDKKAGKPEELEQVNAAKALWTRPKDQISDTEYNDFYKSACKAWDEPATRLHVTVEGTQSFTLLLFIPGDKPMDMFDRDKRGLSLYVRRVFIMDDCKDLLPDWLRFVKGVVDSDDLPLNVSREILQSNDTVQKLRKQIIKRVTDHLAKLANSSDEADKTAFAKIDAAFGTILREALVTDFENKDKVAKLVRYASTWTVGSPADGETRPASTGFEDYIKRMPEGQKAIYVVTGSNRDACANSPHLEGFKKANYEVLFLADPVDEWVIQHFHEFDGKKITSVIQGAADLEDADAKKALEEKATELKPFLDFATTSLGDSVSAVRLTKHLTDSPCRLVGDAHSQSPQMEELLRKMGQEVPKTSRALELNADHPVVVRLRARLESAHDDAAKAAVGDHLAVLRDQALLAEGGRLTDPAAFAKRVQALLLN